MWLLVAQVRAEMFTFEDLQTVDDQSLQALAREIDRGQWAAALRTSNRSFTNRIITRVERQV